ncbi:sugar phosphate isomerase/epimerase family protein [Luteimonas salinilitoris]|uniref:Sugar phosphate isomerase/epimerase family protein n=1 Tax=Luteimonas salinilitoris TaxID=3237697 RepID=A0ABV4HQL9_9GAMM
MHQPSRRKFLARAAALSTAVAASGLPGRLLADPAAKPIGIQLWTVNDALKGDPAGTLNVLAKIGFKEVESAGFAGLEPKQFRRLLDDAGLRCPSAHLQFDLDDLDAAFAQAHALGATYATASSLLEPVGKAMSTELGWKSAMSAEEAKRTADVANRIGEAARRAGLQFALHNHDREFVDLGDGEIGYDIIWRETDPALVQFEIDCGWMAFAGRDPIDYFEKSPGRIPLIHVKDFLPKRDPNAAPTAEEMRGSELGRGVVDYEPIFAAARQAGLKHAFAEQEGPFSRMDPLEAAQVAYDYLNSLT